MGRKTKGVVSTDPAFNDEESASHSARPSVETRMRDQARSVRNLIARNMQAAVNTETGRRDGRAT